MNSSTESRTSLGKLLQCLTLLTVNAAVCLKHLFIETLRDFGAGDGREEGSHLLTPGFGGVLGLLLTNPWMFKDDNTEDEQEMAALVKQLPA